MFIKREECDICGSLNKKILISKRFTDDSVWGFINSYYEGRIEKRLLDYHVYEMAKCLNCSFMWQVYILNDEYMSKLYNEWISAQNSLDKKKFAPKSLFIQYAEEIRIIYQLFKKKPHEIKVLDFGMGWGHWCLMAKAFNLNVKGFELSEDRASYAKKQGINVIDKFSDLEDHQFDFIYINQVFEHIPNPQVTLKYLANLLSTDGIIRISVPNGIKVEKQLKKPGWKAEKNAIHPLEHINCFTQKSLSKMAQNNNINVIKYIDIKYFIKHVFGYNTSLFFKKI